MTAAGNDRTKHARGIGCRCISGVVALALWMTGCDDEGIRTYDVPQTSAVQAAAAEGTSVRPANEVAATQPASSSDELLTEGVAWRLPSGWKRLPGDRPMRVATLEAEKGGRIEISISRFPGDTGGLLANVNRWRQQVGLTPLGESDLPKETTPIQTASMDGHVMRLRGQDQHLLGAVLASPDKSETWFVKATAAPEIVDRHQADFNAFVASARIAPATRPVQ